MSKIIILFLLFFPFADGFSQTSVNIEGVTVNLSKVEIDSDYIKFSIVLSNNSLREYYFIDSSSMAMGYSPKSDSLVFSFSDLNIFSKSYDSFRLVRLGPSQSLTYKIRYRRNYLMLQERNEVNSEPFLPPSKNIYIFLSFIEKKKLNKKYLLKYSDQIRVTTNVMQKLGGVLVTFKGNL